MSYIIPALSDNRNFSSRLYVNGNNFNDNDRGCAFGIALALRPTMKTYKNLYDKIISHKNLILAWEKAKKGKSKIDYIIQFEKNLNENLLKLHYGLKFQTYKPKPLKTFIHRDPKTRKISKSHIGDRVVHHALIRIIDPIFDKIFIYDSCANQKGKGTSLAIKRFDLFKRKVTNNFTKQSFCLKADIQHYFEEVSHEILIEIIKRKITDKKVIQLIEKILANLPLDKLVGGRSPRGMPLGNLTSQSFANIYLNEFDYFVKHELKARYYIRYVDDFVILHSSKGQLEKWKESINNFLKDRLKLTLHPEKSRIIPLSRGIDFVGYRNFLHHKLLRKRNIKKMRSKLNSFARKEIVYRQITGIYQGWQAYARWANTFKLRKQISREIHKIKNSMLKSHKNKWVQKKLLI